MAHSPPVKRAAGKTLLRYLMRHQVTLPGDYLRKSLQLMAQALMDAEVSQMIAASRYERRDSRRAYRNGYRDSRWQTYFGAVAIRVPKLRSGTYAPEFLNHPLAEITLAEVAAEAFLNTPDLCDLREAFARLGLRLENHELAHIQANLFDLVQRVNRDIDARGMISLDRIVISLDGRERELALALCQKYDGKREIVAYDIVRDADERFWQDFIRRLQPAIGARASVQYVNNSNVYHVLRLTETDDPQMAIAA